MGYVVSCMLGRVRGLKGVRGLDEVRELDGVRGLGCVKWDNWVPGESVGSRGLDGVPLVR